jgi:hypothetical protein
MKYLDELRMLNLPKKEYVVFGSGPMAIRGIKENEDIDILVSANIWNSLYDKCKKGKSISGDECLKIGHIEIFKTWPYVDVKRVIADSEMINGIPFAKLEYVIQWKMAMGRKKDLEHVQMIKKWLEGKQNEH